MWCGKCQADVAAEVSPDNQRVFCAACGTLLSTIDAPPNRPQADKLSDRTKDARELLQRWSSGKVIDPFGPAIRTPVLASPSATKTEPAPVPIVEPAGASTAIRPGDDITPMPLAVENAANSLPFSSAVTATLLPEPSGLTLRIDSGVGQTDSVSPSADRPASAIPNPLVAAIEAGPAIPLPSVSPFAGSNEQSSKPVAPPAVNPLASGGNTNFFRVDAAHPADHFAGKAKLPITTQPDSAGPFAATKAAQPETKRTRLWFPTWDPAVWRSEPNVPGGWSSMAGQFLAYAGVLGMTAGACMVVWSYFGGPANYAPTGWLLATAGQMLLFFGVVTLVSGGLEQTTEQVNKRIEQLGDHIIRIEQAAREMSLRGGSVPPAHFGHDPDSALPPRSVASGYERSVVEQ